MNMEGLFRRFLAWFRGFVKANPGTLPILGFEVLLFVCAVLLALGLGALAENLAVVAYFMLVAGVVIQLIDYLREVRRDGRVCG